MEGGNDPAQLPPPSEACVLQRDNTVTRPGEATSPGLGRGPRGSRRALRSPLPLPGALLLQTPECPPPQTLLVSPIRGPLISEASP